MSRSQAFKRSALWAITVFLGCFFGLGGLVMVVFGDCPTDPRPNGLALCSAEQQVVVRVMLALAVVTGLSYGVLHYRGLRRGP